MLLYTSASYCFISFFLSPTTFILFLCLVLYLNNYVSVKSCRLVDIYLWFCHLISCYIFNSSNAWLCEVFLLYIEHKKCFWKSPPSLPIKPILKTSFSEHAPRGGVHSNQGLPCYSTLLSSQIKKYIEEWLSHYML